MADSAVTAAVAVSATALVDPALPVDSSSSLPVSLDSLSLSPSPLSSSLSPAPVAAAAHSKLTYDENGKLITNDPDTGYYDEIEIEDMEYDEGLRSYLYPCPCGDKFRISIDELTSGESIARCPSCSLVIKVIFDADQFYESEEEDD